MLKYRLLPGCRGRIGGQRWAEATADHREAAPDRSSDRLGDPEAEGICGIGLSPASALDRRLERAEGGAVGVVEIHRVGGVGPSQEDAVSHLQCPVVSGVDQGR